MAVDGQKMVTLGWDGLPTIVNEDGTIYPRRAELIFHAKYYPNWPEESWPVNPQTGEKLPIESSGNKLLQRYSSRYNRGGGKRVGERLRQMVSSVFRQKPFR